MLKIKLIMVGVGPHARRTYIPQILRLKESYGTEVTAIVELKETKKATQEYLHSLSMGPAMLFIDRFGGDHLPQQVIRKLDDLNEKYSFSGMVIATDPTVHKPFAAWALKNGLHILMDKPVTTRREAVSNKKEAAAIWKDYQQLLNAYQKLQVKKETIFSINVQRRYHPGFSKVFELIREVAEKTGCPVTSIQSTHTDGQWRLPEEVVKIGYHGYNDGYGTVSHSGYHFFDAVYQFMKAGAQKEKWPDRAEVVSSFTFPQGLLIQMKQSDYGRIFDNHYKQKHSDKELMRLYSGCGEIDAFSTISMVSGKVNICNISINLLHNSFSRRSWITPGNDLYKGNGRVKHEYHNIQQGPFQSIQIHSYQANDKHNNNTEKDYLFGGNSHFDIHVFRNIGILGGNKPHEYLSIDQLLGSELKSEGKLLSEQVKRSVVQEFLQFMRGEITKQDLKSNVTDHAVPVRMMRSIYLSHIQRSKGLNPIISFPM